MAGLYDDVSLQGILDVVGDNPVADYMRKTFPNATAWNPGKDLKHAAGGALSSTLNDDAITDSTPIINQTSKDFYNDISSILAPRKEGVVVNPIEEGVNQGILALVAQNTQMGGESAVKTQQNEIQKSQQEVADKQLAGGSVAPDAATNPAQALAQRNQNLQTGTADNMTGVINPATPPALSPEQQKNATLSQTGKDTFKQMNTVGDWFSSRSFLLGMMQTGLSLLDGKGYSESFATGSRFFDQHYGQEQRSRWANDLLEQGYDRAQVEQYVATGDSSVLVSPQERNNKLLSQQLQLQTAQQNLNNLEYNNSPEVRARELQDRDINNQYKQAQARQMISAYERGPEERAFKNQLNQLQLETARAKLDAAKEGGLAGKTGGINVVQLPSGLSVNISGAEVKPGVHYVLNSRGQIQGDSRWKQAVNIETGESVNIPANLQKYELAGTNARNAINQINNFKVKGLPLLGITGEAKTAILDFFGQRASGDRTAVFKTMQGYVDNLAESRASLENGGFALTDSQLKAARASFPVHFGEVDKNGVFHPAELSKETAGEMLTELNRQVAQIQHLSDEYATPGQVKASNDSQDIVPKGHTIVRNGKTYRAIKTGNLNDPIWELVK